MRAASTRAALLEKRNPMKSASVTESTFPVKARSRGATHTQAANEKMTTAGASSSQGAP